MCRQVEAPADETTRRARARVTSGNDRARESENSVATAARRRLPARALARLRQPAPCVRPLAGPAVDGRSPGGRESRATRSVYPLRQSRRGATRRSTTRCENSERPNVNARARPLSSENIILIIIYLIKRRPVCDFFFFFCFSFSMRFR